MSDARTTPLVRAEPGTSRDRPRTRRPVARAVAVDGASHGLFREPRVLDVAPAFFRDQRPPAGR